MDDGDPFALPPEVDAEARLRRDIEENLKSGRWSTGARLPTERVLSEKFGIARTRVRRVLEGFERDGRISRVVGRGTFVTGLGQATAHVSSEVDIASVSPEELMEVRLIIEPQLAGLLVRRASLADLETIRDLVDQGRRCTSMTQFEGLDHQFHMALTVATKNTYLIGLVSRIQAVRQSPAWSQVRRRGLTSERQQKYQAQHEGILAALEVRDVDALRKAIFDHLNDVSGNLGV